MTDGTKILLAVGAGALALGYVFMRAQPAAEIQPPSGSVDGGLGTQVGGLLTGVSDVVTGGRALWDALRGPKKKTNSGDDETVGTGTAGEAVSAGLMGGFARKASGMHWLNNTPDNMGLDRTSGRMIAPESTVQSKARKQIGLR